MATTLGANNPFRYRGYYYDTETRLYYLQTRYYDPEVCRFISADVYLSTGQGIVGSNMYAYCLNNAITRVDSSGSASTSVMVMLTDGGGNSRIPAKSKSSTSKSQIKRNQNDTGNSKEDKKFIRFNNLAGTYSSKDESTSAIFSLVALTTVVTSSFFTLGQSSIAVGLTGEFLTVGLSTPVSVVLITFGFAMCMYAVSYATYMASNIIIATTYASQGLPFTLTEVFPFVYTVTGD